MDGCEGRAWLTGCLIFSGCETIKGLACLLPRGKLLLGSLINLKARQGRLYPFYLLTLPPCLLAAPSSPQNGKVRKISKKDAAKKLRSGAISKSV